MAKYSREQRDRAVDLYIKYERCAADVIRELGYPSKGALPSWYADRLEEERTGVPSGRGERYRRYTDGQKRAAVDHYLEYGRRPGRTMRMLGYPKSKELLMAWIDELAPGQRKLRHGPVPEELKREAVVAVASGRPESREAAAELGVQDATVREWKRQMLAKSEEATVSGSGKRRTVVESKEPSVKPTVAPNASDAAGPADALASMERKVAELQARLDELDADVERQRREKKELDIEIAIRKGALELSGERAGRRPGKPGQPREDDPRQDRWRDAGRDRRKPVARGGRRARHVPLPARRMKRPDKDAPLLELVREAFENSERRYGYKRIHLEPESMGVRVSAKRIMRLMTSHGLVPLFKSAKRYSSYKGELTKAPKNLVNRDFHAERPNMLWVTDLTEFSIPAGKAYLSPVIDCHDGMPVAWTIGTSPNAELANGMLTDACSTLKDGEKPIIHSD